MRSAYPAGSIWAAHEADKVEPVREWRAETVLVVRPEMQVSVHVLPACDAGSRRLCWPAKHWLRRQRRRSPGTAISTSDPRSSGWCRSARSRDTNPEGRSSHDERHRLLRLRPAPCWRGPRPGSPPSRARCRCWRCVSRSPCRSTNPALTKWDGFLQLSGGAEFLFASEFKLHIFGSQYPYPFPLAAAYGAGIAEIVLPVLLVLGLFTRFAALGLLMMTAIIQITVPEGWANFHLPWAAMALALVVFGGGMIALDAFREPPALNDQWSAPPRRKASGFVPKRARKALLKVERSPKPVSKAMADTASGVESSRSAAWRRRVFSRN